MLVGVGRFRNVDQRVTAGCKGPPPAARATFACSSARHRQFCHVSGKTIRRLPALLLAHHELPPKTATMPEIVDDKSAHCIPFILERLQSHQQRYASHGREPQPPFFLGLNGVQGAGKTTLVGQPSYSLRLKPQCLHPLDYRRLTSSCAPGREAVQHTRGPTSPSPRCSPVYR